MAFNLSKILGGDQVGTAFGKINSNIDKQIVSGNTSGQNLRLVTKDGSIESVSLTPMLSAFTTSSDVSANFVHVSGDTMTGNLVNFQGGTYSTTVRDDGFRITEVELGETIFITHNGNITGTKTAEFTNNSGEIVVISGGSALQGVRRNAGNTGWEYYTISTGGTSNTFSAGTGLQVSNVGGLVTYTYTGSTSSGGGVSGLTFVGGGSQALSSITGNNLVAKTWAGAGTVSIAESGGLITISGSSAPSSGITSASNNGSGQQVYQSATTTNLAFRTLSGSNGFSAYTNGSLVLYKLQDNTVNRVLMNDSGGTAIASTLLQLDATGNFFGIGGNSSTTKFLLPVNTNGLVSSARISKSSINYTGATDGDIWYLNTGNTLKFQKSGTTTDFIFKDNNYQFTGATGTTRAIEVDNNGSIYASRVNVPFGVFNAVSSVTIANTTVETSIISSQLYGTTTLNSSTATTYQHLVAGKKFRFNARGVISTNAIAPTLRIRAFLGTSAFTDSTAGTLTAALTGKFFEIDLTFTIRTQGSTGTMIGTGNGEYTTGVVSAAQFVDLGSLGEITIDTTTDKVFDCKVTFGTADASNSITIYESTLEYLN